MKRQYKSLEYNSNKGAMRCNKCNFTKSLTEFHKDNSNRTGHCVHCKKCRLKKRKEMYDAGLIKHNSEAQKKYYKSGKPYARKYSWKKKLVEYFGGECIKCRYKKCMAALDFHHIDPSTKKFNLDNGAITVARWEECVNEAKKCLLLCSNCHREKHYLEKEILYESLLK